MNPLVSSHRFDAFTCLSAENEAATTKHFKASTIDASTYIPVENEAVTAKHSKVW